MRAAAERVVREYDKTHLTHDVAYEDVAEAIDALRAALSSPETTPAPDAHTHEFVNVIVDGQVVDNPCACGIRPIDLLDERIIETTPAGEDQPFVVRQFEGTPWVPLHEAARLHDAVQESGLTIASLRNTLATGYRGPDWGAIDAALDELSREAAVVRTGDVCQGQFAAGLVVAVHRVRDVLAAADERQRED